MLRLPELGDLLERLGREGPAFLYSGDVAAAVSEWVMDRGGLLTREDLDSYEVVERPPVRARFRGRDVLTNPPPSSGGILIADALELLERLGRPGDTRAVAEAIASTNRARDEEFLAGLSTEDFARRFLAEDVLDSVAGEIASRLGSTTHLTVMDGQGACASVTCSNGSCSGVVVPGTGIHLNNMLGEEDLNPQGFHRHAPGGRVPSMMAPTVVLRAGEPEIALGSAGLEPDQVGDRPDHRGGHGRRPGGAGRGRGAAPARRGRPRRRRARRGPECARGPRARRLEDPALGRAQSLLRRRPGGRPRPADGRADRGRRSAPRRRGRGSRLDRLESIRAAGSYRRSEARVSPQGSLRPPPPRP